MVPKCYARILGDCAGPIEDEHFISRGIQEIVAEARVRGMHWQPDDQWLPIGPGRYAHGRVICKKHHQDLNALGLDPVGIEFFRAVMRLSNQVHGRFGDIGSPASVDLDGSLFRLWMLKVLCGAVSTGHVGENRNVARCGYKSCSVVAHGLPTGTYQSRSTKWWSGATLKRTRRLSTRSSE